ncbi:MAG: hypothetical protein ABIF82_05870 [Planctomycetota bacterium]
MDTVQIEKECTAIVAALPQITAIGTADQANEVSTARATVKKFRARIAEFFRPDIDAAHALHKSLLAKMKAVDEKPAAAEQALSRLLAGWAEAERARVAEEQRRLDDEARKQAAAEAAKEGDKKLAQDIKAGKVAVASTVIATSQKVEGIATVDIWSAEVVDLKALCKAIGTGKTPAEYVLPNGPALNSVMRATKGQATIPGVKAVKKTSVRGV